MTSGLTNESEIDGTTASGGQLHRLVSVWVRRPDQEAPSWRLFASMLVAAAAYEWTCAHQREEIGAMGWAGPHVLVVGPCTAEIEVRSQAARSVRSCSVDRFPHRATSSKLSCCNGSPTPLAPFTRSGPDRGHHRTWRRGTTALASCAALRETATRPQRSMPTRGTWSTAGQGPWRSLEGSSSPTSPRRALSRQMTSRQQPRHSACSSPIWYSTSA